MKPCESDKIHLAYTPFFLILFFILLLRFLDSANRVETSKTGVCLLSYPICQSNIAIEYRYISIIY